MNSGRIGRHAWRSDTEGKVENPGVNPVRDQAEPADHDRATTSSRGWARPKPLRPDRQAHAERIVRLSEYLSAPDRELLCAAFGRGQTPTELGRLLGLGESTVRRRIRTLVRRLNSHAFLYAVREIGRMEPERAAVARICLLRGEPLRVAAAQLGVSIHRVTVLRRTVLDLAKWDEHAARVVNAHFPSPPTP